MKGVLYCPNCGHDLVVLSNGDFWCDCGIFDDLY